MAEEERIPVHGKTKPEDEVKYEERSDLLRNLSRCRQELHSRQAESLSERLRRILHQAKLGLTGSNHKKGTDEYDCVRFSSIEDFTKCAKEIIQQLLVVNSNHDGLLINAGEVENTSRILDDKTVFLCFYGQFSSGKSTILNCILRNRFLPVHRNPETSITLCISPTRDGEEFMNERMRCDNELEGLLPDEIKQNCLVQNGFYIAHGIEDIHCALSKLNKQARTDKKAVRNFKYHLKAKFSLSLDVREGWKVQFIDNPGFDEFSTHVTEVARSGLSISSAFLYVTTFRQHRQIQTSGFFRTMYCSNKDIFKQKRLIVIVNKADEICCHSNNIDAGEDEEDMSEEQVVSEIRASIVEFCDCSPDDVPRDVIIPLYGLWAYTARMLANNSVGRQKVIRILSAMQALPSGQGENPEHSYAQYSNQELASKLEHMTGILQVEERLQEMSRSSIVVWRQKIHNDLELFLKGSIKKLTGKINILKTRQKNRDTELERQLAVMREVYEKFEKVLHHRNYAALYQEFEESFEEDMLEINPRQEALDKVQHNLSKFKKKLSSAMKQRKDYGPEDFVKDLRVFVQELSADLKVIINASFTHMPELSTEKFRLMTSEVVRLGTKFENILRTTARFNDLMKKEVKAAVPKFKAPEIATALSFAPPMLSKSLQDMLLQKCQDTVSTLKKRFPSFRWKCYLADFYDNKHYFIEAFEGTGQDSIVERSSLPCPEISSEKNYKLEKEVEKSEEYAPKVVHVEVDIESDSLSEPASRSSSSLMEAVDETVEDRVQLHAAMSQDTTHDIAVVPVHRDSTQSSEDIEHSSLTSITYSSQDDASCDVPSDQETPTPKKQRGFRKLSELEEELAQLQEALNNEINEYFEKFKEFAVKEFCNSLHEATLSYVKSFEEVYRNQLDEKTEELQMELDDLLANAKALNYSIYHQSVFTYMRTQLAFVVEKHQKNAS